MPMIDRARITAVLPTTLKRRLRPLAAPILYRLERRRLRALYSQFVEPGDLVFDIGAAEGYHTAVFADLGARVVAVEPQPGFADRLRRRAAADPAITVVEAGAGAEPGSIPMSISLGDPEISTFDPAKWSSGRYRGRSWERVVTVAIVTLDQLVRLHGRPAYVKIDVEGWEAPVLEGLGLAPRALSFEFAGEFLDDVDRCLDLIEALAPATYNYSKYRRHRLESPAWLDRAGLLEALRADGDGRLGGDVHVRFA